MMKDDAQQSINRLREQQLTAAMGIAGRCQQLCERILAMQGDMVDASILQLQHDCVQFNGLWEQGPVVIDFNEEMQG